jgi:5-carboxymethyl-2-hydroxymuconate isomerase
MPHVIIEYSANICPARQFAEITKAAHDVMIQSGLFSVADIKTRSYVTEDFFVGEKGNQGRFVHVIIYLLEGRSLVQKQALSEAMRDSLASHLKDVDQLSVDIRELSKDTYRKHVHP